MRVPNLTARENGWNAAFWKIVVQVVRPARSARIRGLWVQDEVRKCAANVYSYANTAEHLASVGVEGAVRCSVRWSARFESVGAE